MGRALFALVTLQTKLLTQSIFVKTYYQVASNEDDRNAHLPALLDHFVALLHVCRNVVLGVGYFIFSKKLLCHVTEMAGRSAVNGYWLHTHVHASF